MVLLEMEAFVGTAMVPTNIASAKETPRYFLECIEVFEVKSSHWASVVGSAIV